MVRPIGVGCVLVHLFPCITCFNDWGFRLILEWHIVDNTVRSGARGASVPLDGLLVSSSRDVEMVRERGRLAACMHDCLHETRAGQFVCRL